MMGQRLEQHMRLTPQMIQSIEILQLSNMALEEHITEELEKNPVLEAEDPSTPPTDGEGTPGETPGGGPGETQVKPVAEADPISVMRQPPDPAR